ncbi:nucleotidyltransferase family protein [Pseudomonas cavernae]|uniref:Nucleotidyltransferase family protein n=1 Tax=Pseudomonas cavernae TaxID=2320867 RepID=A0A385Z6N4_9PSED|nr:nucleotidyltransferase family protein [Pseudomonas cavernae]AYC34371.1 nucleotidyltransferase family protein [Pseudomonas cavernae]
MPQVIALLLAAGCGSRFGSDKRRATLPDGRSLLAASLANARRAFSEVHVLLRPEDDPAALGLPADCPLIRCADAELGLGHSLAAGVRALAGRRSRALAILLGDMPWVAESSLLRLAQAADAERIVFPLYRGERGHPVLFGRRYWPALLRLTGDQGARAVMLAHEEAWLGIEVDDPGVLRDVDTPADLA